MPHDGSAPKGMILHESEEDVFLALELSIDRTLGAPSESGDLTQFSSLVSVAYKDLFRRAKQELPSLSGPQVMFGKFGTFFSPVRAARQGAVPKL
jgi:hypothetical protein